MSGLGVVYIFLSTYYKWVRFDKRGGASTELFEGPES